METITLDRLTSGPTPYILYSKTGDDVKMSTEQFIAACVAHFEGRFGVKPERCEVWHGTGYYLGPCPKKVQA